jgi:RHS repeat-associated protein
VRRVSRTREGTQCPHECRLHPLVRPPRAQRARPTCGCQPAAPFRRARSGRLNYLLSDHLGSQALTLTSAGAQLNTNTELRYYPWGGGRYVAGTTPTSYNFTGQRKDSGSGLLFYNARWYDPTVGRFLQADTIVPQPQNPQNLNRYSYCGSNPLKYVDGSGHNAIEFWGGAGGGGGIAFLAAMAGLAQNVSQQAQSLTVQMAPTVSEMGQVWYVHGNQIIAAADQVSQAAQNAGQAGNTADPGGLDPKDPRFRERPDYNPAQSGALLRQQYERAVRALSDRAAQMRLGGRPLEEVARTLHAERRALGEQFKTMTPPDALEQIYVRNIERYGDRLGPSIDWLIERGLRQGKTMEQIWESIITSASRPGGQDIIPQLLGQ